MPEYLAPGVYVEETSFRAKSIEGVGTSTTGFVGATSYGPTEGEPELMTSFSQFERIYGGLNPLNYGGTELPNYLAHAVRVFFDNGGSRLYISRAYTPESDSEDGRSQAAIPAPAPVIDEVDALVVSSTANTLFFLNQAFAQTQTVKATAITILRYAAGQILANFTVPVAPPLNYDYGITPNIEAQLNARITDQGQPPEIFTPTLRTLIQAADSTYANTNTALTNAATVQGTVGAAAAAGVQQGNAVLEANLPADPAVQSSAAIAPLNTALGNVETANAALESPANNLETALAALVDNTTATAVVNAANALLTEANDVRTAASAVVTPIRNAAEAVTVGRRAAIKNARARFVARFPGTVGDMTVTVTGRLSTNVLTKNPDGESIITQLRSGDLVVIHQRTGPSTGNAFIYSVARTGETWSFTREDGSLLAFSDLTPADNPTDPSDLGDRVYPLTLAVQVEMPSKFFQPMFWEGLSVSGLSARSRDSINQIFGKSISNRMQALETPLVLEVDLQPDVPGGLQPSQLAGFLINRDNWHNQLIDSENENAFLSSVTFQLNGGSDGQRPTPEAYQGSENPSNGIKSGLLSLEDLEEISIVAAPGYSHNWNTRQASILAITQYLINHCTRMRYRVAVLDSPNDQSLSGVREYRALIDTTRAALYYPWIRVLDSESGELNLPPSGFIAGVYARNDVNNGVHKAPANEVVSNAIALEVPINKAQQDVLNPLGVNCIRFFEGRGIRVWGARTVSSDPEWKYLNIRRYFLYLEASIDRGTQWAVFEPNGERLWANIRSTISDFLYNEWVSGALLGSSREEAFRVKCDRSTMTQNDLDNGRLICLIGVAALKPAEFVIFRIGQKTADARS